MTIIIALILSFVMSLILTPQVKKIALNHNIIDKPNERKVHSKIMPRMGGLAIYLAFAFTYSILIIFDLFEPVRFIDAFMIGALIVVITGVLDDKFQIKPIYKLIGQFIAALIVVFYGGKVHVINMPWFDGSFELGWLSIPITILWIVGVSNAVNLIDGLDGLAAGVSMIAATSLLVVSLLMGNMVVALILVALVGAILGFLFFNFHPAKIFMGDTGSLFLGYSLATLSLLEFKQVTMITFIVPIIILGVPIADTIFAIIRRMVNKVPITMPDKNHLHHRLLQKGYSHRKSVLIIYAISIFFGSLAVLSVSVPIWGSIILVILALISMEIIGELTDLIDDKKFKPILKFFKKKKK